MKQGMRRKGREILAFGLIALQVWQPALAEVITSNTATSQGQAANGVPVVNIATPSASGISHNLYKRFDVDPQGLILNNSGQPINTQLGGYIPGNVHLVNGSARLILNEVGGSLPSQLNGYMEVAGQKAEVVIANPSGITCNGCGFINTSVGTLTTGKTLFDSDGSLNGFRVEDGQLYFEGAGLNASNTDRLNLFSRALVLNAELHAKDLKIITGSNQVVYETGTATSIGSSSTAPAFAIDSSSLGGMYANRIRLIGTEAGVGMRLAGPVAAMNGNLEITNSGDVRIVRASAKQAVTIRTDRDLAIDTDGGIERAGISSGAALALMAAGGITLADGVAVTGAATRITSESIFTGNNSEIAARDALTIEAKNQQLSGTIASQKTITMTGGDIANWGNIAGTTGLGIVAGSFDNSGHISSTSGSGRLTIAGELRNDQGQIQQGGTLDITAASISNVNGGIAANGTLLVSATNTSVNNNGGLLQGNEGVTLTAAGLTNQSGEIASNKHISLMSGDGAVDNRNGLIETAGEIALQATGLLQNTGGQFRSGGDLTFVVDAFDRASAGGEFSADGLLQIDAVNNITFSGDTVATPGAFSLISRSGSIAVDSRIEAGGQMQLAADDIMVGKEGFIATQDAFRAIAINLDNQGLMYGKTAVDFIVRDAVNNGSEEYLTNTSLYKNAVILSEGNITITALNDARMSAISNYGGHIESIFGDVTLKANTLNNINIAWAIKDPYDTDLTTYSTSLAAWSNYNRGYAGEDVKVYQYSDKITNNDIENYGNRGQIIAGHDIDIDASSLINDRSTISAKNDAFIRAAVVENAATRLRNSIKRDTGSRYWFCEYNDIGNKKCNKQRQLSEGSQTYLGPEDSSKIIPGIIEAGNKVYVTAGTLINGEPTIEGSTSYIPSGYIPEAPGTAPWEQAPENILNLGIADPTSFSGFNLPSNGLFQIKPPGHPYLIETDSALNTYQGFLGSGYLINHLNWSPEITQRRLGDSYYELMLIRDALMASLGSRFVHPAIADERVQYEYLMDNAIAATESLQLSPGIALSREQIDTLQQDIIWMEERVIAGEHVLVPVVYLAKGSSRVLHDGAVIGGGTIAIDSNTVSNGGLIHTRDQLSINAAQDISNLGGTMEAGGDLLLESGGDILNESGRLAGDNVVLQAEGNITHRTWSQREDFGTTNNGNWNTLVGDTATVEARGTQLQMADGSIHVVGGQLTGNNIGLAAGGSISLDTVQVDQGFKFSGEDWDKREQQIRHLQTQVTALQSLQLQAGADVLAIAADIRAGESATLEAGGNILLLAAESSDHYESHSQHDGSFGRSKSHDLVHDESGLVGTTIQLGNPNDPAALQGNLTISAGNDITLYASQAVATGQADVVAGGNINLIAGINTVSHSEKSNKEGVATYRNNNQGYIEQTAAASAISAGGDLNLNAVNDIHLTASVLHSDQVLRIGGETVDPQTLMEVSENRPMNVVVDTLALTNESWDETSKGYKGPVKELIKAITLAVAPMISVVTVGQVDMPEFNIAEHNRTRNKDVLQAGSSLSADVLSINAKDKVALINADISVAKSAEITANDIVIGAVAETHTAIHDEGHETMTSLGMKLGKDEVRIVGIEMTKRSLVDQSTLVEWNGTTIDAGQLVLKAQHDLAVLGASINVAGDAALVAGNELIIGGYEGGITNQSKEITEVTTISAAVRNAYLDAALTVKAMIEAKDSIKDAKQALADAEDKASRGELDPDDVKYFRINLASATANLVQMEISMAAALAMGAATLGTGFYASGSAQHDKTIATNTTDQGQWQGSDITVGGNAALIAGEKIKVQGSDVNVSSTLIVDAKKIALVSGGEHSSSKSKTTQEHEGFSLSSSSGGINAGMHQTDSDSWGIQYANTHLYTGTLASTSDSLQLAGALIEADNININTGTLSVVSLQDTYESKSKTVGGSIGVSGGLGGVTGASIAADFQKTEAGRRWVAEQSGIIGHNTISIQAEDSVLTGALIANAVRDANDNLVDQGNLQFKTTTLTVSNLYDMDKTKTIGANLAVSKNFGAGTKVQGEQTNAPAGTTSTEAAEKVSKGGVPVNSITGGGLYTGHVTERTTFATLGMGQVEVGGELLTNESSLKVNRDVANTQVITKDQDIGGLNASVTVDGRWLNKEGRAEMLKQQNAVGSNMQLVVRGLGSEIDTGVYLGVSIAGAENPLAITEKVVDMVGSFGLIPTKLNNGGLLAQLPGQFLPGSDANQRQMVGASANSSYVSAHPEMGWVPITETSGYYLLSKIQQEKLKDVVVSSDPIAIEAGIATYQNSTNGMLNTPALAMYNAVTQTHDMINDPSQSVLVTLNYNPTRGGIADGLESLQDKLAIGFGQKWMATNVAIDTGIFVNQVMLARGNEQANFANHSQGNLLNFSGLLAVGLDKAINFGPKNENFNWNMFGSPVNAIEFNYYLKDKKMVLSSSSVNDGDFVGQRLGGNYGLFVAGKENTQFLRVESISADVGVRYQLSKAVTLEQNNESNSSGYISPVLDLIRLFNPVGESTHSNYSCVVNCGAEPMQRNQSTATSEKFL